MFAPCLNIVGTNVKSKFLQIRINEEIKHDLQIVAELRGLSTSALIHSLIVKTIRAEKEREPKAFVSPDIDGAVVAPSSKSRGIPLGRVNEKKRRAG